MQHSPLTYQEVGRMIRACRDATAIPFDRIPDATLGSFSGFRQGDREYEAMVERVVSATNARGLYLGGPQAWMDRPGFDFFQAPDDTFFIRLGVQNSLRSAPSGVAPTEGAED
jgi:hypothetical protein